MVFPLIAAIVAALRTVKNLSDKLSSVESGDLFRKHLRWAVIQKIGAAMMRYSPPFTERAVDVLWEVLWKSELVARDGPVALILNGLKVLGALDGGPLDEYEAWSTKVLEEAGLGAIARFDLDKEIGDFLARVASGLRVANSVPSINNVHRAGDPILLLQGEFERQVLDFQVSGAGIDFELRRTYRSGAVYFGPLGPSWDHSLNLRLLQENDYVVVRLTGKLSEDTFIQHPRFGDAEFSYYAPPDGVHDVVVPDGGTSFLLNRPQGVVYRYEAAGQAGEHRISRIEDRFGNYLNFLYSTENRLERVLVNSPARHVSFDYDEVGRLARVKDHTGRAVDYTYDDRGYLACVAGPGLPGETPARLERYEYDQVGEARKLTRVYDWAGRIVVENEYDRDELSEHFGRVIRQRVNRGESMFQYEPLRGEVDPNVPLRDRPVLCVWETKRNGHQVGHILNHYGNELERRERYVEGGRFREVANRFRYNADGEVIARLDPEGVLTQYLFVRDHLAIQIPWPDVDHVLGNVRMNDRMSFGNRLAEVTRGRRLATSGAAVDPNLWEGRLPSVFEMPDDPDDYIVKYRYEENQLLLSRSDPRYTLSADPLHVESASPVDPSYDPGDTRYAQHQRHLTRIEYGPRPRFELRKTIWPDRTRPSTLDGVTTVGPIEERRDYDSKGRLIRRLDARGHEWYKEYYAPSLDPALAAKEGFLLRELTPHIDWVLNSDTPDILEIERTGVWQASNRYLLSSGTVDEHLTISAEGVRIALYQSNDLAAVASANQQVAVSVDGAPMLPWNQTSDSDYVIDNLSPGVHEIEVRDTSGSPVSIGRIQTHVSVVREVDDLGRVLQEIDSRGNVTVNAVDALGNKTKVTRGSHANPSVVDYQYDPAGQLILEREEWRDEAGMTQGDVAVVRRYEFDSPGLLLSETRGPEKSGKSRITRNRYDLEDNLSETIDGRGMRTYLAYDELNRHTRTVRAACSSDCSVTTMRYDRANRELSRLNPRGAIHYNGYRTQRGGWRSGLDTRGRVRVKTDPLGHMVVTDYDDLDNPTVVRQFQRRTDGQFEMLSRRVTDYDEPGDVVRVTDAIFESPIPTADPVDVTHTDDEFLAAMSIGNVDSAVTEYHLDAHGNTVAVRNADGGLQRRHADPRGRVNDVVTPEGGRKFYIYDGNGSVVRIYAFDPARDPVAGTISHYEVLLRLHEFDELNREVARIDAYGNRWEQRYDTLGNLIKTIDPLGNVVRFDYNAFGEESASIQELTQTGLGGDPISGDLVTRREYDESGNVVAIVDPAERRTEFRYDTLNRLTESWFAVSPAEPKAYKSYDRAGNLVSVIDRNGLVKTMKYDLLDRHRRTDIDTSSVVAQNALSALTPSFASYEYDASGNRTKHQNNYCTVEVSHDSRGLPISERVIVRNIPGAPSQQELVRAFDSVGRRIKTTYPSGREVSHKYDLEGRVTLVRNVSAPADYPGRAANIAGFVVARYTYVGRRLSRAEFGNGLTLVIKRDGRGHVLERQVLRSNNSTLWRLQHLRDAAGNTRIESGMTRGGSRSRKYSLDSAYRLTHHQDEAINWLNSDLVSPPQTPVDPSTANGQTVINNRLGLIGLPSAPSTFEYDEMGNRLSTRIPGTSPVSSTPNNLNQYSTVGGNAWMYDANGNLREDGSREFLYDLNNAVQEIRDGNTNSNEVSYYRDAIGRTIAEQTTAIGFRIYDGNVPLVEISGGNRKEFTQGHLNDVIIHAASGHEDYWLTYDGLNSLRLLTGGVGNIVSLPSFLPFGASEDGELASSPFHFGFAGMWYTPAVPFYHSRRRSYRADLGRHLQRDPAGYVDDLNLYSYVNNNPVNASDPSGYQAENAEADTVSVYIAEDDVTWTGLVAYEASNVGKRPLPPPIRFESVPGEYHDLHAALEVAHWEVRIVEQGIHGLKLDHFIKESPEALRILKNFGRVLKFLGAAGHLTEFVLATREGDVWGQVRSGAGLFLVPWPHLETSLAVGTAIGEGFTIAYEGLLGISVDETMFMIDDMIPGTERYFEQPWMKTNEVWLGRKTVILPSGAEVVAEEISVNNIPVPGRWQTRYRPGPLVEEFESWFR